MGADSITKRLLVKESPGKGRGVFAVRDFEEDEVIETVPVIVLPPEDKPLVRLTMLARYAFGWPCLKGVTAIPLGYGMLHNHSPEPNARWENDFEQNLMHFIALRPIAEGEEIMTNYGRPWGYWKDTVDPPPWWLPFTDRVKRGLKAKRFALMAAAGAVIVGLAVRRRRLDRE